MESNGIDVDKLKALYEHQKAQFASEVERYRRLEEKATRYLASMSFAVGAYFILAKWAIDEVAPAKGAWDCAVIVLLVLTFFSFISSWAFCFASTRLEMFVKPPSRADLIEYFLWNKFDTVLVGMSRRYSEEIGTIERQYEKKLLYVRKAYSEISWSVGYLTVSVAVFIIRCGVST